MSEGESGAASGGGDSPLRLTDEEVSLHDQLIRWYLWATQRLGEPVRRPDAPFQRIFELNRRVAVDLTGQLREDGRRVFMMSIEPSMLALTWAGDEQSGMEDRAVVRALLLDDARDDEPLFVGVAHAYQAPDSFVVLQLDHRRQLVLAVDGARDLARSLLGAVATIDEEERQRAAVKPSDTAGKPPEGGGPETLN